VPQSQFPIANGLTIGNYLASRNGVTDLNDRTEINASILIGTTVLGQLVGYILDVSKTPRPSFLGRTYNNVATIGGHNLTSLTGLDNSTGIGGHTSFHAGTYNRSVRL